MTASRPATIEAALLYQDYQPFAYKPFAERLQMIFGDDLKVKLGVHQDGAFGLISIGSHVVKLSQNDHALGPEGFQGALASPYTRVQQPDAAQIVQNHRKNIFVTVAGEDSVLQGALPDNLSDEMRKIIAEATPKVAPLTIGQFADRVLVTRIIVNQIMAMQAPDIIHWCQSDQFFKPAQFQDSKDPRSMALQIHPVLFSSGAAENGSQKIGFRAFGAEHVCGHEIHVAETPFALPRVIADIHDVIWTLSQGGALPQHGSEMELKSGARFRFSLHEASPKWPNGYIGIEVLEISDSAQAAPRKPAQPKAKSTTGSAAVQPIRPTRPTADTSKSARFGRLRAAVPAAPAATQRTGLAQLGGRLGQVVDDAATRTKFLGKLIGALFLYAIVMQFF